MKITDYFATKILLLILCLFTLYPPNIEAMAKLDLTPATEQEISDFYFVKDILGFPFDYRKEGDKKVQVIPFNYRLLPEEERALQWYKEGLLTAEKRGQTIHKVIQDNYLASKSLSDREIARYGNSAANLLDSSFDRVSLIAALYIAAKVGDIDDCVPFLRFSHIFRVSSAIINPLIIHPDDTITTVGYSAKDKLLYYPAAYALFSYPQKTITMLLKVIPDSSIPENIRLRAATFINTMNPNILDERIFSVCDDEFNIKLYHILDEALIWNDPLIELSDREKEVEKEHWERYKKRLEVSEDINIMDLRNKKKLQDWAFLRTNFDPNK